MYEYCYPRDTFTDRVFLVLGYQPTLIAAFCGMTAQALDKYVVQDRLILQGNPGIIP